jgi:hypothetical protein
VNGIATLLFAFDEAIDGALEECRQIPWGDAVTAELVSSIDLLLHYRRGREDDPIAVTRQGFDTRSGCCFDARRARRVDTPSGRRR